MARLRYNGLTATLGAALTNSGTTITFSAGLTHSGGTNVPTITGTDYIPLTILNATSVPVEIVYLTAYTAAATTGTITRAQESTTGVAHLSGAKAIHSATTRDIGNMEYGSTWAAGTYPAGTMVRNSGTTYVASAATSDVPIPPVNDYGNDFTVLPNMTAAPWTQNVPASRTITASTGEVIPGETITTALRLHGGYQPNTIMWAELTLNFTVAGNITFLEYLSSEGGSDPGIFYIDGVQQHSLTTNHVWTSRTYAVSAGTRVFRWRYQSDGSIQNNDDSYKMTKLRTTGSMVGSAVWEPVGVDVETVRDTMGTALVAGKHVTITPNDGTDTITIASDPFIVLSGETSVDEFDGTTLNAAWVRVDSAGNSGRVTWTQARGVLSVAHTSSADAVAELHALVRPIGTAMAVNDAFITRLVVAGRAATALSAMGLILADGSTYGSGAQVHAMNYISNATGGYMRTEMWARTGYNTSDGTSTTFADMMDTEIWSRVVKLAADVWRCDVSRDGVSWLTAGSLTKAITPTHVGFMASNWGAANPFVGGHDFLRRVSGASTPVG